MNCVDFAALATRLIERFKEDPQKKKKKNSKDSEDPVMEEMFSHNIKTNGVIPLGMALVLADEENGLEILDRHCPVILKNIVCKLANIDVDKKNKNSGGLFGMFSKKAKKSDYHH